ncbi:hypothetical protein [Clostridium botulinum]|uniref:Conserved domain protein n=1 Tax=Clostridium botulinum (strain Kyoto / Type A2) TaxID=536232 RepID=C1FRB5_CLOBJ|nr:hypothetical protein [Clostridium botulinum]ACO85619.1 conserved domain protein [Clostridium botulinum A2 str. Kyoto]AUN07437.1 hypothetical protein RSJ14_12320 [Clostridium botulinum]AUN18233.1 hypothetical protein B2M06_11750 [Clostridium botulinum]MBN3364289.1 hypothetical protein [Clostridium botulinum]MBN3368463.1 hypothetical protein [Clostridium botulinum]
MLDRNDIPYLIQLVNEDRRKIMLAYKNNDELKQAEMTGRVREKVINDLNELYDSLNI